MLTNVYESMKRLFKIDGYILEYDSTSQVVHEQSKSKYLEESIKKGSLHLIYWTEFLCFILKNMIDLIEIFRSSREKHR